jgi:hypothetical protein
MFFVAKGQSNNREFRDKGNGRSFKEVLLEPHNFYAAPAPQHCFRMYS